jgi:hypothetical protein
MEGDAVIEFILSSSMVCAACERLVKNKNAPSAPDPWKQGSGNSMESGGRKLNENKILSSLSKAKRYSPYGESKVSKCESCRKTLRDEGKFCFNCAYSKGICERCGAPVVDSKDMAAYKMSKK